MFDEATVNKYLSKVKKSKSQGSDSIHPKLIKETVVSISKPGSLILFLMFPLAEIGGLLSNFLGAGVGTSLMYPIAEAA
jgi:hypothetical protein